MFCKHEWKVLSETVTESMIEHLKSINRDVVDGYVGMGKRKHIQIVTCDKCGKLHRFVEDI